MKDWRPRTRIFDGMEENIEARMVKRGNNRASLIREEAAMETFLVFWEIVEALV